MKKDDIIQKSDNTKVDVGTVELPRWKALFVPNYYEGMREYNIGLKEGEDITPEMWNYVKKNLHKLGFDNNLSDWMNAVTDVPAYLKWLNKNAPVTTGVITTGIFLNE